MLPTKMMSGTTVLEAWRGSWEVHRAAVLKLDTVSPDPLDGYEECIHRVGENDCF